MRVGTAVEIKASAGEFWSGMLGRISAIMSTHADVTFQDGRSHPFHRDHLKPLEPSFLSLRDAMTIVDKALASEHPRIELIKALRNAYYEGQKARAEFSTLGE